MKLLILPHLLPAPNRDTNTNRILKLLAGGILNHGFIVLLVSGRYSDKKANIHCFLSSGGLAKSINFEFKALWGPSWFYMIAKDKTKETQGCE